MKKPEFLPDGPGVYLMKDRRDNIIYVGKALSIKKRVSQYFQRTGQDPKTSALMKSAADLEHIVTPTETDALILESNLIKEHRPRYNVCMKDDKQYPFIKITLNEDFPRIFLTRRKLTDGARYFGPYINAGAVREILKLLSQIFRIRKCKKKITGRGRSCLNFQIGLCSAPCSGQVGKEEYRRAVDGAVRFLEGRSEELVGELEKRMQEHVSRHEFEAAAVVRDQLHALQTVSARQHITGGFQDWDVVSIALSGGIACAVVLFIRDGTLVGRAGFTLSSVDAGDGEVMGAFLKQYYSDAPIPTEILLNVVPDDDAILAWLRGAAGRKVEISSPVRGRKRELVEMAAKNARSLLETAVMKQKKREKSGPAALHELRDVLDLACLPERVECFDISNLGGSDAVGSMVVFTGGKPDKQGYRHFNIKTVKGVDDPAMMREVISRRLARIASGEDAAPDLMVVDGGAAQLGAALSAMQESGVDIPVIGLAKRLERIHVPGMEGEMALPGSSAALTMLKHIRDESHRFAVSHHRRRRSSRLRSSVLDGIPGIGKKRKELLFRHFGSLDNVKAASLLELEEVPGISKVTARALHDALHYRSKSL